ncbi:hypothetical protein HK103_000047 [Boothiomyces macroporosus]|uniref:Uncharacterized protein n=1 Tax=Boothiomyces macroporosus TaxID=261099 RepID=A0AAD5UPS9_9FUNG|nr:hypothetical protein HK103_000047 [Boothiomyces macroporosus]
MRNWFEIFKKASVNDSNVPTTGFSSQCVYCSQNPIMTKLRDLEQRIMQHQLDHSRRHRHEVNSELKKINTFINDLFAENDRIKQVLEHFLEKGDSN